LCGFEEALLEDPLLSVPSGTSTMASLAAITMVLTLLGDIKMVVLDDHRISMAHVEFEVSRWRRGFRCGEDY
jgi:hypothetical protein